MSLALNGVAIDMANFDFHASYTCKLVHSSSGPSLLAIKELPSFDTISLAEFTADPTVSFTELYASCMQ